MKRLIVLTLAAAALTLPSTALAKSGVVLKVQRGSHLVAVVSNKRVSLVHTAAATRLRVGQRVALRSRTLRNGTLAASSVRVTGRAHAVRFRGLLLRASARQYLVSAGGAVVRITRGSRTVQSARDTGPQPGTTVDVTATVGSDEELDEDHVAAVDAAHPGGAIEGKLVLGTGKVTVVSDHMALVLTVPAGFDLTGFANGDEVLARFTQGTDGTLTLSALSRNGDEQEADEDDGDHNDNHDDNGDQGDHGGD